MSAKTPNVMSWAQARGVVGRVFCTVCRDTDRVSILHKHYYILLAAIVSLAFALRVGVTVKFQGLSSPPKYDAQPDQIEYEQLAFNLSSGRGYSTPAGQLTAHRPPGTSLSLLPVYVIFGRSFFWGRLWLCFLSAATCLAVAWLGRICYGPVVSVLAAAWCAVYPGHFYYAQHYVSEVPFGLWITLACGSMLCAYRSEKKATLADVCAGIFLGMAILTRPQAVFVLPIIGLCVLFPPRAMRRNVFHFSIQTLVVLLALAPWMVRNAFVLGKPTLSTVGGYTFWGAHNDVIFSNPKLYGSWIPTSDLTSARYPLKGNEIEKEAATWRYGFESISRHVEKMPSLVAMKLWRTVSPTVDTPNLAARIAFGLGWVLTLPFVLGGIVLAKKDDSITRLVLLTPIVMTLITVVIFYGSDRFRDSVAPVFLVIAARAAIEGFTVGAIVFRKWKSSRIKGIFRGNSASKEWIL